MGRGRANGTGRYLSKASGSGFQTADTTFSNGSSENEPTPANTPQVRMKALCHIESEVGGLDQYVMDKVGYESGDDVPLCIRD